MAEKPILFSGPMVRAILEGRKTQTRRVVKHSPFHGSPNWETAYTDGKPGYQYLHVQHDGGEYGDETVQRLYPAYQPGDQLWVRETWATRADLGTHVEYRANRQEQAERPFAHIYDEETRWRNSIFMPRWASRITLEVTDVRCQRL